MQQPAEQPLQQLLLPRYHSWVQPESNSDSSSCDNSNRNRGLYSEKDVCVHKRDPVKYHHVYDSYSNKQIRAVNTDTN
jgi:hypothetical protein